MSEGRRSKVAQAVKAIPVGGSAIILGSTIRRRRSGDYIIEVADAEGPLKTDPIQYADQSAQWLLDLADEASAAPVR